MPNATTFHCTTRSARTGTIIYPPGATFVDRDVTESLPWDFYLQPHTALKGTARVAHYIVLYDEVTRHEALKSTEKEAPIRPTNLLAKITQSMCYLLGHVPKDQPCRLLCRRCSLAQDARSRVFTTERESRQWRDLLQKRHWNVGRTAYRLGWTCQDE